MAKKSVGTLFSQSALNLTIALLADFQCQANI